MKVAGGNLVCKFYQVLYEWKKWCKVSVNALEMKEHYNRALHRSHASFLFCLVEAFLNGKYMYMQNIWFVGQISHNKWLFALYDICIDDTTFVRALWSRCSQLEQKKNLWLILLVQVLLWIVVVHQCSIGTTTV